MLDIYAHLTLIQSKPNCIAEPTDIAEPSDKIGTHTAEGELERFLFASFILNHMTAYDLFYLVSL